MTKEFQDTLYLFSCGALGKEAKLDHEINLELISRIAHKQGIWQTVFLAVEGLYKSQQINIESDMYERWKKEFISLAAYQMRKRVVINMVLESLRKNGIEAYVLKGDVVAQFYKEPLSRISSDTDIFVGKKVLDDAEKVFEQCGFTVHARSPMEHHTVCDHPVGGNVDLHQTFHDDVFEQEMFCNYTDITEEGVQYSTDDGYKYLSLGVNDNAIFLFLHMAKHFLSCGTGIRQIMDFLLFLKNNKESIDVQRFEKMLKDLCLEGLFSACVFIGTEYLQLNKEDFDQFHIATSEFFVNWLLMDIEQGGIYGKLDQRKLTLYYLFGNKMAFAGDSNDSITLIKRYIKTFSYSFLSRKYTYLARHRALIPVALLHRAFDVIRSGVKVINTIKKTKKDSDEINNIKSRINIVKKICENCKDL